MARPRCSRLACAARACPAGKELGEGAPWESYSFSSSSSSSIKRAGSTDATNQGVSAKLESSAISKMFGENTPIRGRGRRRGRVRFRQRRPSWLLNSSSFPARRAVPAVGYTRSKDPLLRAVLPSGLKARDLEVEGLRRKKRQGVGEGFSLSRFP
jgi:hypothetical protein